MARMLGGTGRASRARRPIAAALSLLLFFAAAVAAVVAAAAAPPPPDAPSPPPSPSPQQKQDPWTSSPACPFWPRTGIITPDREGRLWGYLEATRTSCAFKDAASGQAKQLDGWDLAFACGDAPTPATSTADRLGRLWGWDEPRRRSCAYKDEGTGRPRLYDGYEPGDWLRTPACPGAAEAGAAAAFDALAATDGQFKTWSWGAYADAPRLCAEKDDRQAPIPARPSEYLRLSFVDAPPCGGSETDPSEAPSPDNSRPDRDGFLWGWQRARPCAWKRVTRDPETGRLASTTPLYYPGYQGPRTAANEPPTGWAGGGRAAAPYPPPPSSSQQQQQQQGAKVDVPPADQDVRYRRAGTEGPLPWLAMGPSPSPPPPSSP